MTSRYAIGLLSSFLASASAAQLPIWHQRYPTSAPPWAVALAYDGGNQRTLCCYQDTAGFVAISAWDGTAWSAVPATNPPAARSGAACFDRRRGVLVLLLENSGSATAIWEFGSGVWTQVAGGGPAFSGDFSLHYAPAFSACYAVGSTNATGTTEVWRFASGSWQRLPTSRAPSRRNSYRTCFDPDRGRIVLFSGDAGLTDTWEWDGVDWTQRQPANSPPARATGAFVFDTRRHRGVLFSVTDPFTWEWDGSTWLLNLTAPPNVGGRMAYDAQRGRMVLLASGTAAATWEYFTPLQASFVAFGTACAGSGGTPALGNVAGSLLWLGEVLSCRLTNLPASPVAVPFGLIGVSRQAWLGIPLPFDAAAIGAPGCSLYVSVEQSVQLANSGGAADWQFPIPGSIALLGARFYQQALVLDPGANALGAVFTNAAETRIGDQ